MWRAGVGIGVLLGALACAGAPPWGGSPRTGSGFAPDPGPATPPPPIPAPPELPNVDEELEPLRVRVGRQTRTAWLHVPADADADPLPLVVTFGAGDGRRAARWFGNHLDDGPLLLFPDAVEPGRPDEDDGARWDLDRGEALISSLVGEVRERHDVASVHVVGFAPGGRLAWYLLCDGIEGVDAYAIVAEGMPKERFKGCAAREPTLLVQGTEDRRSPWGGDDRTVGVVEVVDMLAWRHGCSGERLVELPDLARDDETQVVRHAWTCRKAALQLLEIRGGGRAWPGTEAKMATRDIDGAEEILAFFAGAAAP